MLEYLLLAVIFVVAPIAGAMHGNKQTAEKNNGVKMSLPFVAWYTIKQIFLFFIGFAIFVGIVTTFFLKGEIWEYIFLALGCVINYLYMKNKVQEEYEIWQSSLDPEKRKEFEKKLSMEQQSTNTDTPATNSTSCPHAGKVIANGDVSFWGTSWKNAEVIMIIKPNWHVTDKHGKKIGWIGNDGAIRDQAVIGDVKPDQTLAPFSGETIAKVFDSGIWAANEKIGAIVNW